MIDRVTPRRGSGLVPVNSSGIIRLFHSISFIWSRFGAIDGYAQADQLAYYGLLI